MIDLAAAIAIAIGLISIILVSRSLAKPIRKLDAAMTRLAGGDLAVEPPALGRRGVYASIAARVRADQAGDGRGRPAGARRDGAARRARGERDRPPPNRSRTRRRRARAGANRQRAGGSVRAPVRRQPDLPHLRGVPARLSEGERRLQRGHRPDAAAPSRSSPTPCAASASTPTRSRTPPTTCRAAPSSRRRRWRRPPPRSARSPRP